MSPTTRSPKSATLIERDFGKPFLPEQPNVYKTKAQNAQEAHEAIRPSSVLHTPEDVSPYLQDDELKVYKLIWQRFVASQMTAAIFDQTTVDIDATSKAAAGESAARYNFRVTGSVLKFEGFLKVYKESKEAEDDEDESLKHKLPPLDRGPGACVLRSSNPSSISPSRRRASMRLRW